MNMNVNIRNTSKNLNTFQCLQRCSLLRHFLRSVKDFAIGEDKVFTSRPKIIVYIINITVCCICCNSRATHTGGVHELNSLLESELHLTGQGIAEIPGIFLAHGHSLETFFDV